MAEESVRCLNDPTMPTIKAGSSVDKCIFKTGFYIPSTSVPLVLRPTRGGDQMGLAPYLAITMPELSISDHYPFLLPIPCDVPQEAFRSRQLKIEGRSEEEWGEHGEQLRPLLQTADPSLAKADRLTIST